VIRLFRSELLRATSRRLLRFLLIAALAGTAVAMVIATVNSRQPTAEDAQRAERMYQRELQRCLDGDYGIPPGQLEDMGYPDLEAFCDDNVRPEFFTSVQGLRLSGLSEVLQGTAPILVMLAIVLGASLVGADWSAGSMATLLTWEPRRVRVFLVRALVVSIVVLLAALLLEAAFVGMWRLGVALRGTADSTTWFSDAVDVVVRTGVVAVIFGLFAYAGAALTRSTAGGVFILLGELVLIEGVLRGLRPSIERWTLIANATAYVSDQGYGGDGTAPTTPTAALVTLVVYAGLALLVALAFTQRRDVT
jgi:ABC-2 type transport system permease protein